MSGMKVVQMCHWDCPHNGDILVETSGSFSGGMLSRGNVLYLCGSKGGVEIPAICNDCGFDIIIRIFTVDNGGHHGNNDES